MKIDGEGRAGEVSEVLVKRTITEEVLWSLSAFMSFARTRMTSSSPRHVT